MAKSWIGTPPEKCDICEIPIARMKAPFVDGKTLAGPWANMCVQKDGGCAYAYGVGLGTGKGQRYDWDGRRYVKTEG